MTCHSKPAPAAELDAQLAVELDVHGDARTILRDALRWRLIESHLVAAEGLVPQTMGARGTIVAMRWPLGIAGVVRGGAGAVLDAILQQRRLDRAMARPAFGDIPLCSCGEPTCRGGCGDA